MNKLNDILQHNEQFVQNKEYEAYRTSRFPDKKMVVLTCMDTRLVELLPRAMNLRNGDVKLIKNAGAIVTQPFGNIMRSIIVALYELNAEEVFVVGHHECGMTGLNADHIKEKMQDRGIQPEIIQTLEHSGIHLSNWLKGFNDVQEGVRNSVSIIRNHPLLPPNVPVHGLIMHPETGKLDLIVDGYDHLDT